jgi:uncharacterized repeat protein (TIGR02543 family)
MGWKYSGDAPSATKHLYNSEVIVASTGSLLRSGFTFYSWNTDSTGKGNDYNPGDYILMEKNITLFARWTRNKYQVVYYGNGNDAGTAPSAAEYEYNAIVTIADKKAL